MEKLQLQSLMGLANNTSGMRYSARALFESYNIASFNPYIEAWTPPTNPFTINSGEGNQAKVDDKLHIVQDMDQVHITLDNSPTEETELKSIELYTLDGKRVDQQIIGGKEFTYKIKLSHGVYALRTLTTDGKSVTQFIFVK